MAFWNQERLHAEIGKFELITPFLAKNLENGAYALGVAAEYAITTANGGGEKRTVAKGDNITIPPGQFALLLTEEAIAIPADAIGFISMKARWKMRGLINVSGFHVDPGFSGKLKFAVYNAGNQSLDLEPGQRLFLIWYSELDSPTKHTYKGPNQNQTGITPEDVRSIRGLVGSPAGLNARIDALEQRITTELSKTKNEILSKITTTFAAPLVIGLIAAILTPIYLQKCDNDNGRDPSLMRAIDAGPFGTASPAPPDASPPPDARVTAPDATPTQPDTGIIDATPVAP